MGRDVCGHLSSAQGGGRRDLGASQPWTAVHRLTAPGGLWAAAETHSVEGAWGALVHGRNRLPLHCAPWDGWCCPWNPQRGCETWLPTWGGLTPTQPCRLGRQQVPALSFMVPHHGGPALAVASWRSTRRPNSSPLLPTRRHRVTPSGEAEREWPFCHLARSSRPSSHHQQGGAGGWAVQGLSCVCGVT